MLQYKIPQNVEREDQILSFLTMKQLAILAAGGFVCYLIYISLASTFYIEVWGSLILIPAALTVAIAFLKINGVSFSKWLLLAMEYNINPQKRIWNNSTSVQQEMMAIISQSKPVKKKETSEKLNQKAEKKQKTLSELVAEMEQNSHTQEILNDSMEKIQSVRPELSPNKNRSIPKNIEEILEENKKKIEGDEV